MNVIDLEKLENKVSQGDGFQCYCPACGEDGKNLNKRDHLRVWANGAFSCILYPSDKQHNARILQLVGTESDGTQFTYVAPEPKVNQPQTWNLSLLDKLIRDYSYYESRGISAETQQYFKMGVALSGQLNGRALFPIFNEQKTHIIGFSGRITNYTAWHKDNKIIKHKHLGKSSHFIWPREPQEIKKSGSVILVESPGCALWLWEQGVKNVLCLFGVNISSKIIAYLISLNPARILISTNNELGSSNGGIGNKKAVQIRETLMNFFSEERVLVALPDVKDFGDYHNLSENSEIKFDNWRGKWHV
jgi:hypothetical protein